MKSTFDNITISIMAEFRFVSHTNRLEMVTPTRDQHYNINEFAKWGDAAYNQYIQVLELLLDAIINNIDVELFDPNYSTIGDHITIGDKMRIKKTLFNDTKIRSEFVAAFQEMLTWYKSFLPSKYPLVWVKIQDGNIVYIKHGYINKTIKHDLIIMFPMGELNDFIDGLTKSSSYKGTVIPSNLKDKVTDALRKVFPDKFPKLLPSTTNDDKIDKIRSAQLSIVKHSDSYGHLINYSVRIWRQMDNRVDDLLDIRLLPEGLKTLASALRNPHEPSVDAMSTVTYSGESLYITKFGEDKTASCAGYVPKECLHTLIDNLTRINTEESGQTPKKSSSSWSDDHSSRRDSWVDVFKDHKTDGVYGVRILELDSNDEIFMLYVSLMDLKPVASALRSPGFWILSSGHQYEYGYDQSSETFSYRASESRLIIHKSKIPKDSVNTLVHKLEAAYNQEVNNGKPKINILKDGSGGYIIQIKSISNIHAPSHGLKSIALALQDPGKYPSIDPTFMVAYDMAHETLKVTTTNQSRLESYDRKIPRQYIKEMIEKIDEMLKS